MVAALKLRAVAALEGVSEVVDLEVATLYFRRL